jgi:hypothetical protein
MHECGPGEHHLARTFSVKLLPKLILIKIT